MRAKSYLTNKAEISTQLDDQPPASTFLTQTFGVRFLALVVTFFVGLVSGLVFQIPNPPDSPFIDSTIEIRRRVD